MDDVAEHGRHGGRRRPGRRRRPAGGPRRGRVALLSTVAGIAGIAAFGATLGGLHVLLGDDGKRSDDGGGGADCRNGCALAPTAVPSAAPTVADSVPPRGPSPSVSASATATATASPSRTPSPSPSARRTARPADGRDRPGGPPDPGRPDGGGALAASYSVGQRWESGFIGQITVVNRGPDAVASWRLTAVFPHARVLSGWASLGGVGTDHDGGRITGSGGTLGPGDTVTVGFQAEGRPDPPSACTLNGSPC